MFGGVGLYHRGVFFGIIAGDTLYLKVDDTSRREYESAGMGPNRQVVVYPADMPSLPNSAPGPFRPRGRRR